MKKLLLVATVQSHIAQFHKPLIRLLQANGWEVHVAARNNLAEKNGLRLDEPDRVFDVPFQRSPFSPKNVAAYRQLRQLLRQHRYDVIHCNTPVGGILTRLAARTYRRSGTQVFYTAHGFHFYKGAPLKNWLLYYPVEKWMSRFTDKLITITEEDYALAKEKFHCPVCHIHGVGVDGDRYCPVASGEKQRLRVQMGFAPEQKLILCVGELLPNKNQAMAIRMIRRAVQAYPDAMLLIAGNGPERDNLLRAAEDCGVADHVKLLGYCTNLQDYQHISDVSVSCSKREGLPLNIVEAMLSGTPVVATENRGHRELIHSGETGYLVPAGDWELMAQYVMKLLGDSALYSELAQNAKQAADAYAVASVVEELTFIYDLGK